MFFTVMFLEIAIGVVVTGNVHDIEESACIGPGCPVAGGRYHAGIILFLGPGNKLL